MMPGAPCKAFGGATAVFVGMVTDIKSTPRTADGRGGERDWSPLTVTFSVSEAFSGVEGAEAQVSTGMGGGDCGYSFVKGVSYIVYAYRMGGGGQRLVTSICTRTRPALGASEDLEYLRGLAGRAHGVNISGQVVRRDDEGPREKAGVAGLHLIVEGEGARHELVTDAAGRYSVSGLSPGKYKVTLRAPDGLADSQPEREVQVADRGCAVEDFYVFDNGRISGRAIDPEGKSMANLTVVLRDADAADGERAKSPILTSADEEGRFQFEGLPAGRYLLGVRLSEYGSPGDLENAYPRTFDPAAERAEEAEVIELKQGEELKGRDLRLPPRRAETSIRVKMVWEDGKPVANAQVIYRDVTYGEPPINHSVVANERGEAVLKGYVGSVYRIWASSERPSQNTPGGDGSTGSAAPVTLKTTSPVMAFTIVVRKLK
jgi:hypothetical protein